MSSNTATDESLSDAALDHIWTRRHYTLFRLQLSADYHLARARHFTFVDRLITACVVASSSYAVVSLFGDGTDTGKAMAAVAGAVSIAQLIFDPAGYARKHATLAAEFRQVMASAIRAGEHWTTEQCDDFTARLTELEVAEPAPMAAVVLECENLAATRAHEPVRVDLPWYVRIAKHWIPFDASWLLSRFPHRQA